MCCSLWNEEKLTVLSVAPLEIFASKMIALLTRTAPRDLYDMHNMVKFGLFDESEETMLRKCAVFYSAIGAAQPPEKFELDNIGKVSFQQIKRALDPVLRKGEGFNLEFAQREVREYLAFILLPTKEEELFWKAFSEGNYYPDWCSGIVKSLGMWQSIQWHYGSAGTRKKISSLWRKVAQRRRRK